MAKMFYSFEEAQEQFGLTAEQLEKLVGDGKLREFRDGSKKMYKASELKQVTEVVVESDDADEQAKGAGSDDSFTAALSGEGDGDPLSLTGSSEISLQPGDSADDMHIGLPGDTGEDIQLNLSDSGPIDEMSLTGSSEISLQPGDSADDLTYDLSSTGSSLTLPEAEDSADRISLDDSVITTPDKDDTVVTTHGKAVISDESGELPADLDDMGQTQMAPDPSEFGIGDEVNLDSGSSGSGLLDLSREADDTSLGAELLEEIYPGGEEGGLDTQLPTQLEMDSASVTATATGGGGVSGAMDMGGEPTTMVMEYTRVETMDPVSGAYGAMLVVPLIALIYMACVSAAGITGTQPALIEMLDAYYLYVIGGAAALTLIVWGVATMVLKPSTPGAPKVKKEKPKKAPKEKKKKKK